MAKWGGWEMLEIKKSWLTFYGLSDHDFPIKWMFRLRRNEGFSGWFPISPSSTLRAPSTSREKVFLRFLKQWILQLRVNPACRMTWGWGESGRRNRFIKVCRYKRHDKNRSCSTLNSWINQKSMLEASIKNQCRQCQQLFQTASISMRRVSTASAQSINMQSIQCL